MSKMGETKQKILDSLGNKSKTLTDLSNELDLAPSTIAEHIRDLLSMNAIREIDDIPRKWKYYEINPTFSPEQYHMSFMRRQGLILSVGIVVAIAVIGSLLYITNSNYNSITACTPKPGYICGSPEANSSGTLSVVLGGQNKTIAVQGIGCSYNSSPPSTFTPYHATLTANAGARLDVSCPQPSAQQASQSTVVHIWLNYTANGIGVVAEVANLTRPPVYYTTVPTTTTAQPTTTIPYTTIPQYYQNGNSNGTVLQSAPGGSVLIAPGLTYICAAGSYASTIRSASWSPDSSTGVYSSIGRSYGNLCSVLGGTTSQDNYIALAGVSVNQANPIVYATTGAPDTGLTQLNFSVLDPDSEVVIAIASGGGTFITGVNPSLYCTVNQNDYHQISAGWTPLVYIATCTAQTPGNYNIKATGVSGNPQYYYGNGWLSMAAYVFPSGIPPSTTTSVYTTVPTTSTTYSTTAPTTSVQTTTTAVPQDCGLLKTIYVNQTLSCQGYMVLLTDLSQPAQNQSINQSTGSAADLAVYYNGAYQASMQIFPNPAQVALYTSQQANTTLAIQVNKTFAGLYAYQKWAQVEIYAITKQPSTTTTQTTSTISTTTSTTSTSVATTTTVPVTTNQSAMYVYNPGLTPNTAAAYALFTPVFSPLYVGSNITDSPFTVHLADLSQPNQNNVSTAIIYIYYNGALTNTTQLLPGQVDEYTVSGRTITVYVNSTYAVGLYSHWAKIELSFSPVTITINQTVSQGPFSLLLRKVTNSTTYFNILQNGTVIRSNMSLVLGHIAYV